MFFFAGGFQHHTVTDDVFGYTKKTIIPSLSSEKKNFKPADIGGLFVLKKSATPVMMTAAT